jgi:uncharacterized membrane protein
MTSGNMRIFSLLLLVGIHFGCGTGADTADRTSGVPSGDSTPPRIALTAFAYECIDDTYVVAKFDEQESMTLFLSTGTVRLAREPSASGVLHANSTVVFWSKGRDATIEYTDGRRVECVENRRQSWIEDAKLRGADYRATGNEPGWTLELFSDSIRFVTAYGTELYSFTTPAPEVDQQNRRTIYRTSSAEHGLTVTITYGICSDDMSGESFESTVELLFDGSALRGCGQALH